MLLYSQLWVIIDMIKSALNSPEFPPNGKFIRAKHEHACEPGDLSLYLLVQKLKLTVTIYSAAILSGTSCYYRVGFTTVEYQ